MLTKVVQYELKLMSIRGGGGGWKPYTDFYYDDGVILTCYHNNPGEVHVNVEYANEMRNEKVELQSELQSLGEEIRELWRKKTNLEVKFKKAWTSLKGRVLLQNEVSNI